MNRVLLISPHFDDAVLSAGQFMAGRPSVDVLTVFGGKPTPPVAEWRYDQQCGFDSPDAANEGRKAEDREALALLQANPIHLDFIDGQYQEANDEAQIDEALLRQISQERYELVAGPLGFAHPDHDTVFNAICRVAQFIDTPVYLWEDLPARVLWPEKVHPRTRGMSLEFIGDGPLELKLEALKCYKSQWGRDILIERYCLVPERFWKLQ